MNNTDWIEVFHFLRFLEAVASIFGIDSLGVMDVLEEEVVGLGYPWQSMLANFNWGN